MDVEDQLGRVDGLDESLKFTVVRMGRVRNLEVERQVLIVLIVPASQDYENCGEFSVALIYATKESVKNILATYSCAFKSLIDLMWIKLSVGSVVNSSGFRSISLILRIRSSSTTILHLKSAARFRNTSSFPRVYEKRKIL